MHTCDIANCKHNATVQMTTRDPKTNKRKVYRYCEPCADTQAALARTLRLPFSTDAL